MGCQVRRELWLVDLLGKLRRGREREEPSPCPRLVPPALALTRWLEVVVPPVLGVLSFRGTSEPLACGAVGGAYSIASWVVIRSQGRGEGLEHEPQVCQVNPVPVAGVR